MISHASTEFLVGFVGSESVCVVGQVNSFLTWLNNCACFRPLTHNFFIHCNSWRALVIGAMHEESFPSRFNISINLCSSVAFVQAFSWKAGPNLGEISPGSDKPLSDQYHAPEIDTALMKLALVGFECEPHCLQPWQLGLQSCLQLSVMLTLHAPAMRMLSMRHRTTGSILTSWFIHHW